jgi:hypothetical protein
VQPDKDAVQKHAYEAFYSHGGCCAGAVAGILETMAEQNGYPYNQINARMFATGAGGYGAQTLCGSLGGALAVIGLFCEQKDAAAIRDQLYAWYKDAAFPCISLRSSRSRPCPAPSCARIPWAPT